MIEAVPGYAEGEDPEINGWPVSHMPRTDHACFDYNGESYRLVMLNSQNYTLYGKGGNTAVQIIHRGISGGWNIDAEDAFSPELLCGLFIFSKYLARENEFPMI